MLKTLNKLKRFSERNGGSLIQAVARRYLATLYIHSQVRRLASYFFSTRKPEKWIFLVGCYNSGTTICRDILGIHPEIGILPREGVRFSSLLPRPEEKGWIRMWVGCPEHMKMPTDNQKQISDRIIKDWSPWWKKTARVFLEKSITNITRMKWLDDNFENAYFIGITRNAYPVVEGIKRRASPEGEAKEILGSDQYPIDLVGQQWVDANSRLLEGGKIVKNYYAIKYEDLVDDPLSVLDRLWDFLEITPVKTSFNDTVLTIDDRKLELRNMNKASIARLSTENIEALNPVIKLTQERLGYKIISKQEVVQKTNE